MRIRKPAVAGQFYSADPQRLKSEIEALVDKKAKKQNAIACMLPHAGYMYSGAVACATVSHINLKDNIIIFGPNHTGCGQPFSIMTSGTWLTPLGGIDINSELASEILSNSKHLQDDPSAHAEEHSLEVELPILQYFKPVFQIVPVVLLTDEINIIQEIGKEVATTIKRYNIADSCMIVASSDMTHYEPQGIARKKDNEAIQAILELDGEKLLTKVVNMNISMCGYAPVIAMLSAAKELGAKKAQLIKYQTSGDVTHDTESVVGYAGIIIS